MQYDVKNYVYYSYLGTIYRANRDGFDYVRRSQYKVEYYDEQHNKWVEDDFNLGMEVLNPDSDAIELGNAEYAQYIASDVMESDIKIEDVGNKSGRKNLDDYTDEELGNISYAEFKDLIFDSLLNYQEDMEDIVRFWEEEQEMFQEYYQDLKKEEKRGSWLSGILYGCFMMI